MVRIVHREVCLGTQKSQLNIYHQSIASFTSFMFQHTLMSYITLSFQGFGTKTLVQLSFIAFPIVFWWVIVKIGKFLLRNMSTVRIIFYFLYFLPVCFVKSDMNTLISIEVMRHLK